MQPAARSAALISIRAAANNRASSADCCAAASERCVRVAAAARRFAARTSGHPTPADAARRRAARQEIRPRALGAGRHAGHLKILKLNVDDAPQVSQRYGVRGIPLLVLMRDGAEVDRLVGAVPHARLRDWLGPYLERSARPM